jgi:hypothetical protein
MGARITSPLERILEMSPTFQALAPSMQEHHTLIAQAVAPISKKGS